MLVFMPCGVCDTRMLASHLKALYIPRHTAPMQSKPIALGLLQNKLQVQGP